MYHEENVAKKDDKKAMNHLWIAAIGGDLGARAELAALAHNAKNIKLAMKHWILAAEAGQDTFAKALRANQSANYELKSEQRDVAAVYCARKPHLNV